MPFNAVALFPLSFIKILYTVKVQAKAVEDTVSVPAKNIDIEIMPIRKNFDSIFSILYCFCSNDCCGY